MSNNNIIARVPFIFTWKTNIEDTLLPSKFEIIENTKNPNKAKSAVKKSLRLPRTTNELIKPVKV